MRMGRLTSPGARVSACGWIATNWVNTQIYTAVWDLIRMTRIRSGRAGRRLFRMIVGRIQMMMLNRDFEPVRTPPACNSARLQGSTPEACVPEERRQE